LARFIHSILETNAAVSADGDEVIDLPVNPLSVILIHVSPLNDTGTIGNYQLLEGLLSAVDTVRVSHKGAAIVNLSGVDLAVLNMLWHGIQIWQSNQVNTNNDRRSLVLPVIFGRRAFLADECFPETKKGELQLTITWDIADTGFDGLRRSIETIELPEASPSFVQKITTLAQTFAATGQNDIDLPIGNLLRAVLLFGTTGFAGASPAASLAQLSLLVDNIQTHFSASDFEVLRGLHGLRGVPFAPDGRHIHDPNFDVTSADGTDLATTQTLANEIKADLNALTEIEPPEAGASIDDNYVLMDLDPTRDDQYSLDTSGAGRVNVRVDADAADAVRAIPIERVPTAIFLGS